MRVKGNAVLAWDLDGLIADVEITRRELAKKMFGVTVEGYVGREQIARAAKVSPDNAGFLDKYGSFERMLQFDRTTCLSVPLVPGAQESIAYFARLGFSQYSVASREGPASVLAGEWINFRRVGLPWLHCVGKEPDAKLTKLKELRADVYADDSLTQLRRIEDANVVPSLYWFSKQGDVPEGSRILRVDSWKALHDAVIEKFEYIR